MTSASGHGCHGDVVGHFSEDTPRPPVPGEEGVDVVKSDLIRPESYEPEGRASPYPAPLRWAESLYMLLDDEEGIAHFRTFLSQIDCAEVIDFWFACSGFRLAYDATPSSSSSDMLDKQKLKLAKVIYRKYITYGGMLQRKIRPETKIWICERLHCKLLDSELFQKAKAEVQEMMEYELYPLFLKSEIFINYTREHGVEQETESYKQGLSGHSQETKTSKEERKQPKEDTHNKPNLENDKLEVPGLVVERGEWTESEIKESIKKGPVNLESSNGVPWHQRCTHRRNMQHTHRMLMDPQKFASELISRLELVQRERFNQRRVHQSDHDNISMPTSSYLTHSMVQRCSIHHEDPYSILNEGVQREMKSPDSSSCRRHTHPEDILLHEDRGLHPADGLSTSAPSNEGEELGYSMTVAYYFCGEPIPYRTSVKRRDVTLAHFKELLTKKGTYRFYFKKASEEFVCGVVYEEVREDGDVLPVFENRIIGKVENLLGN